MNINQAEETILKGLKDIINSDSFKLLQAHKAGLPSSILAVYQNSLEKFDAPIVPTQGNFKLWDGAGTFAVEKKTTVTPADTHSEPYKEPEKKVIDPLPQNKIEDVKLTAELEAMDEVQLKAWIKSNGGQYAAAAKIGNLRRIAAKMIK